MGVPRVQMAESGPEFSRLAYGFWRLAEWDMSTEQLLNRINVCLENGLTTFDHADIYGDYVCESLFGEALKQQPALREKMEIVTKCGIALVSENRPDHIIKHYDTSKEHLINSVNTSLQNLNTNYIDLLLIHRPDPLMDPDEIAEAFRQLKKDGKVLHFGVSNFTPSQCRMLQSRLDIPLVTNQVELSVTEMSTLHDGTVDYCLETGMIPMAWSPFGGGSIFTSDSHQAVRLRETLNEIGQAHGDFTIDQVALAWLLAHPSNIVPIIGTGKEKRLLSGIGALGLELNRQEWFKIWTASTGTEVP